MSIQWRNFQERLSPISVKLRLVNNRPDLSWLIFDWSEHFMEFTTCLIHLFWIAKIEFGHGNEWLLILVKKIGTQVIGKFTVETDKQMDPFLHINQTPTRFITCNILTWHNYHRQNWPNNLSHFISSNLHNISITHFMSLYYSQLKADLNLKWVITIIVLMWSEMQCRIFPWPSFAR